MQLTEQQMAILESIVVNGGTGARINYYTALASFGNPYGAVGLSVALEHELAGRVANAFFMSVAMDEGVQVTASQWQSIGDELMRQDFAARSAKHIINQDGIVYYEDISYDDIKLYHQVVYNTLGNTVPLGQGVSIQAWTAYAPVTALGLGAWDTMLTGGAIDMALFLKSMLAAAYLDDDPHAFLWVATSFKIWDVAFESGSPLMFPDEIADAEIVLGTLDPDAATVFAPVTANPKKVFLGLEGDDSFDLAPAAGEERFYDGGDGSDTFIFRDHAQASIHGGEGLDILNASAATTALRFDLSGESAARSLNAASGVIMNSVEAIIGSSKDDEFHFSEVPFLTGVQGVQGGAGSDTIVMPSSVSHHSVGDRYLDLASGKYGNFTTVAGIENVIGGAEEDRVRGSGSANRIVGLGGEDHIEAEGGDDYVRGGEGRDQIWGGAGNDTLYGDADDDRLYGGGDNDRLYGGAGEDYIYGEAGNDSILGGANNDRIEGGLGNDTIRGEDGWDHIEGGAGTNVLYGGLNSDTFVFGHGVDYVMDFQPLVDRLMNEDFVNPGYSQSGSYVVVSGYAGTMYLANTVLADVQHAHDMGLLWA